MVVIFTVIGTALLTSTLSGSKQVNYRESDLQALSYAEMGVEFTQAFIESELEQYKDEDGNIDLLKIAGFEPGSYIENNFNFAEVFEQLFKNIGDDIEGHESENFNYTIDNFTIDIDEEANQISGTITFDSEGNVDGISKKLRNTLSVSAGGIFEVLSYAVGAQGNVFLHGGSTIEGNLYTGKNLFLYDHAQVYSNGDRYVPSTYPCLDSNESRVMGSIIKVNNISNYSRHLSQSGGTGASYSTVSPANYSTYFSCDPPTVSKIDADFSIIDVTSSENRFKINSPNVRPDGDERYWSFLFYRYRYLDLNGDYSKLLVKPRFRYLSPILNDSKHFGGLHLEDKSFIRDGADLTFGWEDSEGNFNGGLYVDGDLYIGDENTSSNENNINNYENISIKGPIYVNGDLIIRGADVQFDSSLYVAGETEIRNSRVRGIQGNTAEESSLILFGNGPVRISNISSFENDRLKISRVRGFFYSNATLEMYGVGSNIEIEGGIFAKNIVLNAIRGDSYSTNNKSGYYSPSGVSWSFETATNQKNVKSKNDSRLRVNHNANLIENPPDALPQAENIIIRHIKRELID